jgi:hypothetical protein
MLWNGRADIGPCEVNSNDMKVLRTDLESWELDLSQYAMSNMNGVQLAEL